MSKKSEPVAMPLSVIIVSGLFILLLIALPVSAASVGSEAVWAMILIALLGFFWLVLCLAIGLSAAEKGRNFATFFFVSFLVSPIIMGIIVASISPSPGSKRFQEQTAMPIAGSNQSAAEQIEKLGELLEKGLISKAEFDSKKSELLKRI